MEKPAWHSDASLGYAILRLTFGVNIGLRGLVRIVNGTDVFAAGLLKQFEGVPLPAFAIESFGYVLPWVEASLGLLLVLGLWMRPALIAGGLMMTCLTFGTMLRQDYQVAWLQLTYALFFFLLIVWRQWNVVSLDTWLGRPAARQDAARKATGIT